MIFHTTKSAYRVTLCNKWNKYKFWRYYKRKNARGRCWLLWSITIAWLEVECYAMNRKEKKNEY